MQRPSYEFSHKQVASQQTVWKYRDLHSPQSGGAYLEIIIAQHKEVIVAVLV